MAEIVCPNPDCQQSYPVTSEHDGKRVRCKKCKISFSVNFSGVQPVALAAETQVRESEQTGGSVSSTEKIPMRLGRFEIRKLLGRGAFGTVYLAYDPQLQRDIALKLLQRTGDEKQDRHRTNRFLQEGRAAARLQHPHIVPVFDAGQDPESGEYYLASAFIDGSTLDDLVEDQPLGNERSTAIVRQLADALNYAHQKGILHRDVKPANVMVDQEGTPFVMDFGLARLEESEERITKDGSLMGTPAYMSPEQVAGKHDTLSGASDQYSLGCLLYKLLSGRTPFEGPWQTQIHHHLNTIPEPPSRFNPDISRDLETICMKCLNKKIEERYASCRELKEDLERWQAGEPIKARPLNTFQRFTRWCRREPVVASLTASVFLVFAVGFSVSLWQWNRANAEKLNVQESQKILQKKNEELLLEQQKLSEKQQQLIKARDEAEGHLSFAKAQQKIAEQYAARADEKAKEADESAALAQQKTIEAEKSAELAGQQAKELEKQALQVRKQLYLSDMRLIASAWEDNNLDLILDRLENHRPADSAQDLRGFEWYYWKNLASTSLMTYSGHTDSINCLAFSLDGTQVATGSDDRSIRVWELQSGQLRKLLNEHQKGVTALEFGPDGTTLISGDAEGAVILWDLVTGQAMQKLEGLLSPVTDVHLSSSSEKLALASSLDGTAKIWETQSGQGKLLRNLDHGGIPVVRAAFERNGKVVTWTNNGVTSQWDLETTQAPATSRYPTSILDVAVSPSDPRLVVAAQDERFARVLSKTTGENLGRLLGHNGFVTCVDYSPDGSLIATGSKDRAVMLWDSTRGDRLQTLKGHGREITSLRFSRDGRKLLTASKDRTARLWNTKLKDPDPGARSSSRELDRRHALEISDASFNNDGTLLVTSSKDGTAILWNADSGELLQVFQDRRQPGSIDAAGISPEHNLVITVGNCREAPISVREIESGRPVRQLKGHTQEVADVAFSSTGNQFVTTGYDGKILLWDSETYQIIREFPGKRSRVFSVAFSSDDARIVVGCQSRTAIIWEVATGKHLRTLNGHSGMVYDACFSRDGQWVITGSEDKTAKVWNASTGKLQFSIEGHTDEVSSVSISPDGRRILTGSLDGNAKIWDFDSQEELLKLESHTGGILCAKFSPNGRKIVTTGMDRVTRIWFAQ